MIRYIGAPSDLHGHTGPILLQHNSIPLLLPTEDRGILPPTIVCMDYHELLPALTIPMIAKRLEEGLDKGSMEHIVVNIGDRPGGTGLTQKHQGLMQDMDPTTVILKALERITPGGTATLEDRHGTMDHQYLMQGPLQMEDNPP